jgi:hypothetical protein
MPVLLRDTAARIERCVTAGHVGLIELLSQQNDNRLGAEVHAFADDVVGTCVTGEPDLQWLQHVTGLSPHTVDLLPEITAWYAARHLSPRFEIAPEQPFGDLADSLAAAGFVQREFVDLLWAPEGVMHADLDDLAHIEVIHVEPGTVDADDFGRVLLAGHEVEDSSVEHHAALAAMAAVEGRSCYLASIDTVPVGAAILTVLDGVGYLTNASTVPDARQRGAQQALIAHRIADAEVAGCDVLAGLANPFLSSHRNMERAGLAVAYTKVSWTRRPGS